MREEKKTAHIHIQLKLIIVLAKESGKRTESRHYAVSVKRKEIHIFKVPQWTTCSRKKGGKFMIFQIENWYLLLNLLFKRKRAKCGRCFRLDTPFPHSHCIISLSFSLHFCKMCSCERQTEKERKEENFNCLWIHWKWLRRWCFYFSYQHTIISKRVDKMARQVASARST